MEFICTCRKDKIIRENTEIIKKSMEEILSVCPELILLTFQFSKYYGKFSINVGGERRASYGYTFDGQSIIDMCEQIKKYD